MNKPVIYADHAATTALSPRALDAMMPFLTHEYANPSTLYHLSYAAKKAVKSARERIADSIGAAPEEIYFTSCGTEADNWAVKSIALRQFHLQKRVITSAIEHHAILHSCDFLQLMGYDVVYLPVDSAGVVMPDTLKSAINRDTVLVSVMTANNEIGTVEPVEELARIAHSKGVLFHTDAVQAVGHIPLNVRELGIDLLSASAHKFNGPKGAGFLYIRKGTEIEPYLHGGGQEMGLRSGTENVAGIVGMAEALSEHMETLEKDRERLEFLRTFLLSCLKSSGIRFLVNGFENHIPGSLSLSFFHSDGEMILHRLDLMGIAVATGSACNSKESVLSHVIRAIGVPDDYAQGTVRISLGTDNNEEQIRKIADALIRVLGESETD